MRKPRRPRIEMIEAVDWDERKRRRREDREAGPRERIRRKFAPRLREILERQRPSEERDS